jgi:RND family efflux transporter MFP subunit
LVTGRIVKVGDNFHEGGVIGKGDLLVQIDPFDYETALGEQESMLKEARVRLEMSRRDYARMVELHGENNISDQLLDDAELDVQQQESKVEQREIGVRRARRDLSETRLTAPFSGVVNGVDAELGKQLSTNDKVADLIDLNRLEARFSLSNAQYGRLLEGDEAIVGRRATVLWEVGETDLDFNATVGWAGAEITSTTGGVDAYATIETKGTSTALRPGAFVTVTLKDRKYSDVYRLPDAALYGADSIYIVDAGRLALRKIKIEGRSGEDILFRSNAQPALERGDQVVVTQLREAGVGSKVEVREQT